MEYLATGVIPRRRGNCQWGNGESGVYRAKDGYIFSYTNNWPAICKAIGRAELTNDPRFNTAEKRGNWGPAFSMIDEVNSIVEDWTKTKTRKEAVEALRNEGVICERIQSIPEIFEDPYIQKREHKTFVEVEHPTMGKIRLQRSPLNLSETPAQIKSADTTMGFHNAEVLGNLLGYESEEIVALRKEGVI
jgi:crotonobetainyl-CoA:carnitine CoA-transferase CaiB-like acyl-CoA transferase